MSEWFGFFGGVGFVICKFVVKFGVFVIISKWMWKYLKLYDVLNFIVID